MIETKIIIRQKNSNASKSSVSSSVSGGGSGEADHTILADKAKKAEVADTANYANTAGYANRAAYASIAGELSEEAEVLQKFLRKDVDDTEKGVITFEKIQKFLSGLVAEKMARLKDGAEFGEFMSGLYAGKGASIDSHGNAEVESLKVRSYMEVLELIVNRLSALEGDQLFTESDTIESVEDLGGNCYGLHLKSKYDGYFTAQHVGNVVKGIVNNLATAATSGTSAKYYTSWMRINSVNAANNYIEVSLYPDEEVPSGKNFPPCELMNIARYGNQTDESLQSCFYISSTEGRIVKLTGVTKPILENYNYGMVFGTVPDFIKSLDLPLVPGRDYMYAAGIVTQDIIQIDYQGKPVVSYVDRGQWDVDTLYYGGTLNEETQRYETSDVWYTGCRWRCLKTGFGSEPRWNNTGWAMLEGNPAFVVDFEESDTVYDFDNFRAPLTIKATLYGQDVTGDILDNDVEWTRYTEDGNGVQRVASDNIWAQAHAKAGKAIVLTQEDLSIDSGGIPQRIRFTATVTLRDGMGDDVATESITMEY